KETETPAHLKMNSTGSEWPVDKQVVFSLTVLLALSGVVGDSLLCWLLCSQVRSSPCMVYLLNLTTADIINLCCLAAVLLEETIALHHQVMFSITVFLEHISYVSDTAGLSLLAALSVESSLGVLFPSWNSHRPQHTSTVASAVSWALAIALHTVSALCDFWEKALACSLFQKGFLAFHMLLCLLTCLSNLALTFRSLCCPQQCSPMRIYHVICTMTITFLLWGLPLVAIRYLPEEEDVSLAFDLLLLLSMVISTAHPATYFLAWCLRWQRCREPLKVTLQRALLSEME
uniref:G-protein coupled receptors family 1 profile domain-containing protein n=1 Tax=Otolemur garnettii TaxID=30611 RepID=H0XXH6_OTOGA